jgi:hypothetical protein
VAESGVNEQIQGREASRAGFACAIGRVPSDRAHNFRLIVRRTMSSESKLVATILEFEPLPMDPDYLHSNIVFLDVLLKVAADTWIAPAEGASDVCTILTTASPIAERSKT